MSPAFPINSYPRQFIHLIQFTLVQSNISDITKSFNFPSSLRRRRTYRYRSTPLNQSTVHLTSSSLPQPVSEFQPSCDPVQTNPLNAHSSPLSPTRTTQTQTQPQRCANSTPTRTPAATPRPSSPPSARPQLWCSALAPAAKFGQRSRWRRIARLAAPPPAAAMATSIAAW